MAAVGDKRSFLDNIAATEVPIQTLLLEWSIRAGVASVWRSADRKHCAEFTDLSDVRHNRDGAVLGVKRVSPSDRYERLLADLQDRVEKTTAD